MPTLLLLATLAALAASPSLAAAQDAPTGRIFGRVHDSATGEPLHQARVTTDRGDTLLTSFSGAFIVDDVAAGHVLVQVSYAGFVDRSAVVRVRPDSTTELDVGLAPVAHALEPIEVTVRPTRRARQMEGYLRRREFGTGTFFDAEELERLPLGPLGDVLRHVPRITVSPRSSPTRGYFVEFREAICKVKVWLDGVERRGAFSDVELANLMATELEAVEVYVGAEVPAEFYDPAGGGCVTMVVWSR